MESVYTLENTRINLARHYLKKLRTASVGYRRGHENTTDALTRFDQDWLQIKHWWEWINDNLHGDDQLARLSIDYSLSAEELFNIRQTPQERLERLGKGLAAARTIHDQQAEGICLFQMAWAIHKQSRLEEAEITAQRALMVTEAAGDTLYMGRTLTLLGEIAMRGGNYERAWAWCSRSLDLLSALQADPYLMDTYFVLSEIAYHQGELSVALDYARQSVHLLETSGVERNSGLILNWMGVVSFETGEYDTGEYYLSQNVANSRIKGDHVALALSLCMLGYLETSRGRYAEAEKYFDEAHPMAQSTAEAWLIRLLELEQAYLFYARGDWQIAEQKLHRAAENGRRHGYRGYLAQALNFLAEVQVSTNRLTEARATLAEGLTIAYGDGNRLETRRGLLVAAQYAAQSGSDEQAVEWLGVLLHQPHVITPIVNNGLRLYAELETRLERAPFEAALRRGQSLDFDGVMQHILAEFTGNDG